MDRCRATRPSGTQRSKHTKGMQHEQLGSDRPADDDDAEDDTSSTRLFVDVFHGSGVVVEGIRAAAGAHGREAPGGHGPAPGGEQVEEASTTTRTRSTSAAPPARTRSSASGLGIMNFIGGRVGLVGALASCVVGDNLKERIGSIEEKMARYREGRRKVQEEMMMMMMYPVLPRLGMRTALMRRYCVAPTLSMIGSSCNRGAVAGVARCQPMMTWKFCPMRSRDQREMS
mmetsp:Transcript_116957/g.376200  ORF Transcript_116957/g.376200 Transcript_116957/m.376200 type:complete len:229 (+) Transcript_116957:60-746(+)